MAAHLVRRQYLQVEVAGTEGDGLAVQQRLPALFRDTVVPAMGAVLDRIAPHDDVLIVDRLELDAGALVIADLERDLAGSVVRALETKLKELRVPRSCPSVGGAIGRDADWATGGNLQQRSRRELSYEALGYFLTNGMLPWWFRLPAGKTLELVLLQLWEEITGGPSRREADQVLLALSSATGRKRLIRQFSPLFRETLVQLLLPPAAAAFKEAEFVLGTLPLETGVRKECEEEFWAEIVSAVAEGKSARLPELVRALLRLLFSRGAIGDEVIRELQQRWPAVLPESVVATGSNHVPGKTEAGGPERAPALEESRLQERPCRPSGVPSEIEEEAAAGCYVENAGAVLLHPFLQRFFEGVAIADGERLLDPERAISLLHYLCTGASTAPEYEVTLFKVLCNVELELPVESEVGLTAVEEEEADALLLAVIGHWEALRNASADALRGTFLLRPGKLSLREDGDWLLQVEHQTVDILLDHLPWGISMVKLPWMAQILWVEWR